MATIFTPTPGAFTNLVPATALASGTTLGTKQTLDLTGKVGAFLYARIGRNAATALTRSGYLAVRPTGKGTFNSTATAYDRISSAGACAATTVASGGAAAATSVVLTSGTGFAAGDVVCLQLAGARLEFGRVIDLTTNTLTVDQAFRTSHSAADVACNGSDVFDRLWLPGDEIYEVTPVNNSGQTLIFMADYLPYASDQGV